MRAPFAFLLGRGNLRRDFKTIEFARESPVKAGNKVLRMVPKRAADFKELVIEIDPASLQIARLSLIDWHHIGQQPFARLARSRQVDDALIGRCQAWIAEHYAERAPVAAMARLSGLAERSFVRRFRLATGMAPLQYVHTLRIEEAKHLLETTPQPIEAIAGEVGYEDAAYFGRLFRRAVNLTPAQYRRRFGSLRTALQR